jgi:hypothetical protein
MRKFISDLRKSLSQACPAFLHVPPQTAYPYVTLEVEQSLQALPWGPRIVKLNVKIWSQYKGTQEILKLAKSIEGHLHAYSSSVLGISLKLLESTMVFLPNTQTRVHTFRMCARLQENAHE